jgi:hypothetical protein
MRFSTRDGNRVIDCTFVNSTVITFYPPLTYANTSYENATAPAREVLSTNTGMSDMFYVNGTVARFNSSMMFQSWIVPPINNTLAPVPTDTVVNINAKSNVKFVYVNNTLVAAYYPPTNINST